MRISVGPDAGRQGVAPGATGGDVTGGWTPWRVLGADSTFSLALPDADPTASQLYAPRGVLLDTDPGTGSTRVVAADTGNHRLMVWPSLPDADGADCAVVVGQPDMRSEGPQAGGRGPRRGLHLPTGLARCRTADGADLVLVADGWNHRVLGYDAHLSVADPEPVWWLGQPSLEDVEANRGGEPGPSTLYWPFGVTWVDGWLWVSDTGNRRVLGWHGLPATPDAPADVVLGQPTPDERGENRGGAVGPDTFRWPHQVVVLDGVLWVADAGNHRLLGWWLPVGGDRPADLVLGQAGFDTAAEMPHRPQGPARLRFPYAVTAAGERLLVADTANNRVLVWDDPPGLTRPDLPVVGAPAQAVLGQLNLDSSGENRWTAVTDDGLCWPYGLSAHHDPVLGDLVAVADSGNNRVVLWRRPR